MAAVLPVSATPGQSQPIQMSHPVPGWTLRARSLILEAAVAAFVKAIGPERRDDARRVWVREEVSRGAVLAGGG